MDRRHFVAALPALGLLGCANSQEKPAAPLPVFTISERELITNFYANARRGSPTKSLPEQQAKPGDTLVSGSRPAKLPTALDSQLPALPPPYTRLTLGADVILVNRDTHQITDVIPRIAY